MLPTLFQWIHVGAAVVGVGGMGFLVAVLLPGSRVLDPVERDLLLQAVLRRFRWVTWTVIILLLGSGVYNVRQVWEVPPGLYWTWLDVKIVLALVVFFISLCLTLPLPVFEGVRTRRKFWLWTAFTLALAVIFVSAYLRRA